MSSLLETIDFLEHSYLEVVHSNQVIRTELSHMREARCHLELTSQRYENWIHGDLRALERHVDNITDNSRKPNSQYPKLYLLTTMQQNLENIKECFRKPPMLHQGPEQISPITQPVGIFRDTDEGSFLLRELDLNVLEPIGRIKNKLKKMVTVQQKLPAFCKVISIVYQMRDQHHERLLQLARKIYDQKFP